LVALVRGKAAKPLNQGEQHEHSYRSAFGIVE